MTYLVTLDRQAAAGLQANNPDVIVVAGGAAALSETLDHRIADLLRDIQVHRIASANRTETAELIDKMSIKRPILTGATVMGGVGIDGQLNVRHRRESHAADTRRPHRHGERRSGRRDNPC